MDFWEGQKRIAPLRVDLHGSLGEHGICGFITSVVMGRTNYTVRCADRLPATEVRIVLPGNDRILNLYEVEVFGYPWRAPKLDRGRGLPASSDSSDPYRAPDLDRGRGLPASSDSSDTQGS
jgi:hypothetical protein